MPKTAKNVGDSQPDTPEKVLHQYQIDRHAAHAANDNRLDDLAFKTSERYDQWILTLSGGALAISLTFLEKIAPEPASNTLWLLGLSWLAYISAIVAGFFAIHYSREAIYREMEIARENYNTFMSTSTVDNPSGNAPPTSENRHRTHVSLSNAISRYCLAAGTGLLCTFALINLSSAKISKATEKQKAIAFTLNLPQSVINYLTNANTGTNMSKEGDKPAAIKPVVATPPDGTIKGIHVGDTTPVKGSYIPPTSNAPIPPPPAPKK
jgi:hypothetical protein